MLESTIWFDFSHVNGFLAAYLENGLACPVLFQIADDFRGRFPEILQDCVLCQCWAFKCISPGKTIDVHADAATVSLNFWITPNSANIESETGGMVVYRNETPPEWQLTGYDQDISAIRQFLSEQSDKKVEIPYNENRAVIFNSKLFHETSRPVFKPGYENHRINVTMLFGTG